MRIHDDIIYVGVNDYDVTLFEGQFPLNEGMAYNSYLIIDDKIALLDTVEKKLNNLWLDKIDKVLKGKKIDYLIIHHMEPDHSSNILSIVEKYKDIILVSTSKSFEMMRNFFSEDFINNSIIVKDYDVLSLGKHELVFYMAPMVHWPEVMMSYDKKSKILFSSDAFGRFGVNDNKKEWKDEARRYYYGIIGKYGKQVQSIINKIKDLDIEIICSLHGPVLKGDLDYYFNYYKLWSNYDYEEDGIVIVYCSVYGNTKEVILYLKEVLDKKGYKKVVIYDLIYCDLFMALSIAFKYKTLILASITYNNDIFPLMKMFINYLIERNYQKRNICLIENGSFALNANNIMKKMLDNCQNLNYINPFISIKSVLKENDKTQIDELIKRMKGSEN